MNRKSIGLLAVILLLAVGCAPKANAPEDIAAIKALSTDFSQAANAGDVSALVSLYTDDAVSLGPNRPILVGKEAIESDMRGALDLYSEAWAEVVEDVQVVGDLAFMRGTYTDKLTCKVPGPAVIDDKGKWICVCRRQPDGSWKFVADIWNSDLPVAQVLTAWDADEQALLQAERDWASAILNMDAAALDRVLADSFVSNSQGKTTTKAQIVADLKSGAIKVESVELSDMRVLVFGDHAVVNGVVSEKLTRRGKDAGGKFRWTDVFEKQDGRWRAVTGYTVKIE